jgi:putative lipoprotein
MIILRELPTRTKITARRTNMRQQCLAWISGFCLVTRRSLVGCSVAGALGLLTIGWFGSLPAVAQDPFNGRLSPAGPIGPELARPRWKLGIEAEDLDTGVRIVEVYPGTAASRAGLEPGDVIVTVNGFQVGFVGRQLFDAGDEFQKRADSRGYVQLLIWDGRDGSLVNRIVHLDSRTPLPPRGQTDVIRGTVSFDGRGRLPADAVLEIRLMETSHREPLPRVVADVVYEQIDGRPIQYSLEFNPRDLNPNGRYILDAQVWSGGQLIADNGQGDPVFERGQDTRQPFPIRVSAQRFRGPQN